MNQPRPLTEKEAHCVELVKMFEKACDARLHTVTLNMSEKAHQAVLDLDARWNVMRVLAVGHDVKSNRFRITFRLLEFQKYMLHLIQMFKMTLLIDNRIKTSDGLVISNDYLNQEPPRRK